MLARGTSATSEEVLIRVFDVETFTMTHGYLLSEQMMEEFLHIILTGKDRQELQLAKIFSSFFWKPTLRSAKETGKKRKSTQAPCACCHKTKNYPQTDNMNRLAIHLNNTAVGELQEGSMPTAMESIVFACNLTADSRHVHDTRLDPSHLSRSTQSPPPPSL